MERSFLKWKWKQSLVWLVILAMTLGMAPVSMSSAAKKAKLNKQSVKLKVGKTVKLKVKNNNKKVKWSSNKKKIATVSKKGLVKAKKAGKAKITAKIGKKKLVCKVTVVKKGGQSAEDPEDPYGSEAPSASPGSHASASPKPTASAKPDGDLNPPVTIGDRTAFSMISPQLNADGTTASQVMRTVTLGMTAAEVETALSGGQITKTKSPQGYDVMEYRTSGVGVPTTGYMVIYLDAGQVVSIFAVGRNLSYGDVIRTQNNGSQLMSTDLDGNWSQDGFYQASGSTASGVYKQTVNDVDVCLYVDSSRLKTDGSEAAHQVFGIQVFPSSYAEAMTKASTDFTYEQEQLTAMSREMTAIIQAYRYAIKLSAAQEDPKLVECAQEFLDAEIANGLQEEPGRTEEEMKQAIFTDTPYVDCSEIGAFGCVDAISFTGYIMSAEDGRIAKNGENIGVASGASPGTDQYLTFILIDMGKE